MKNTLKISAVLSWINMILWGFVVLTGLLLGVTMGNFGLMVISFFFAVIPLHSYAALQLHKSIRNPAIPLSNQTPVGIRFIGFVASFIGILYIAQGFAVIQDPAGALQLMKSQMAELKTLTVDSLRLGGIFALILGLSISINVFLNFRLLRWYIFRKNNDPR